MHALETYQQRTPGRDGQVPRAAILGLRPPRPGPAWRCAVGWQWSSEPGERGILVCTREDGVTIYGIRYEDEHGRDHKRKIGPSLPAARQELQAAKKEVERRKMQVLRGVEEPGDGLTLGDLWRRYEPELRKKASFRDDRRYAQVWLGFFGEDRPIRAIRPEDVRAWKRRKGQERTRSGRPPAPATINRHVAFLKRLFNLAQGDELTTLQPVRRNAMEQENNLRRRFLTVAEELALEAQDPKADLWRAIQAALWTGLRAGEQCRLLRADVDLVHQLIVVRASKGHDDEHLPLHPEAVAVLREVLASHSERLVFPGWSPDRLHKHLRRLCRQAEVENLHWHDLRRTFCSRLAMAGVPMPEIQRLARHATLEVTNERYAYLSPDYLRGSLRKLENGKSTGKLLLSMRSYPRLQVSSALRLGS